MNKKEQEKDDNDYVDTTGVDYESTLNETEPEFLRKIYNIFLLFFHLYLYILYSFIVTIIFYQV
jgi:hypothetical protein